MPADDALLPIIGVRLGEGRSGGTLLMQLLGSSPAIVFDQRYPAEYRFASYFARMAAQMTEPFDESRHPSVNSIFFGPSPAWGPVPFTSEVVDPPRLTASLLSAMWSAWSGEVRLTHPHARYYAEKLAVPVLSLVEAGLPVQVIDLVRDPRDVLASIRAFTRGGVEWNAGRAGHDDVDDFIDRVGHGLDTMIATPPTLDRVVVRYENLATDIEGCAARLGEWLDVRLDASAVIAQRDAYRHHMTSASVDASIGRWRQDLNLSEADRIVVALGPRLQELGCAV